MNYQASTDSAGQNAPETLQPEGAGTPERHINCKRGRWIGPTLLLASLVGVSAALTAWKINATQTAQAAAANQPEHGESITVATAAERQHRHTTTSIGTVTALRSVVLRNELAGTVRDVRLTPGEVVEEGTLLVALDVAVEEAELASQEAEAALARTSLERLERAAQSRATPQIEVDRARAQLQVAEARIARIKAVVARKTIRAPFRARVGMNDVHPGQYLVEGAFLTTLQGVDVPVHVDFSVPQQVADYLKPGEQVEILPGSGRPATKAEIVALDARVNATTRSTTVRALVANSATLPAPGASVRVKVPAGDPITAVSIPASALRKGPAGDHVFVITEDETGKSRAKVRPVQAGAALGDQVLVLSGLEAGEKVAAHGSFKLRENALVVIGQPQTLAAR